MSRKRDYIQEIVARKGRLKKRTVRFKQFTLRAAAIVEGFDFVKSLKPRLPIHKELLKYFPIGFIACVEGYFRIALADLIDSGPPFIDRIREFKDIRFKTDDVLSLQSKQVTIGEFIAHLLPIRNISDINKHISTIIGEDFITRLENTLIDPDEPDTLGEDFSYLISKVEQLFHLRHIYAHELATKEKLKIRQIDKCMISASLFVLTTEMYILEEFIKKIPPQKKQQNG